jgi:hypothetical protein
MGQIVPQVPQFEDHVFLLHVSQLNKVLQGDSEIQEANFLKCVTTATVTKGPLRAEEGYVQNVLLQGTDSRVNLLNS